MRSAFIWNRSITRATPRNELHVGLVFSQLHAGCMFCVPCLTCVNSYWLATTRRRKRLHVVTIITILALTAVIAIIIEHDNASRSG